MSEQEEEEIIQARILEQAKAVMVERARIEWKKTDEYKNLRNLALEKKRKELQGSPQ